MICGLIQKKRTAFLIVYPIIHTVLVLSTIFLSLIGGFRKPTVKFPWIHPPELWQKIVWLMSDILLWIFAAPILALEKLTGLSILTVSNWGVLFLLLNGLFYGLVINVIQIKLSQRKILK